VIASSPKISAFDPLLHRTFAEPMDLLMPMKARVFIIRMCGFTAF
jgi:hypothetical protein